MGGALLREDQPIVPSDIYCRCGNMETVPPKAVYSHLCPLCGKGYSLFAWLKGQKRSNLQQSCPLNILPNEPLTASREHSEPPQGHLRSQSATTPEIWRKTAGHPEYEVSNHGRVRRGRSARGASVGRVLLFVPARKRRTVMLNCRGKRKCVAVDDLVRAAFGE